LVLTPLTKLLVWDLLIFWLEKISLEPRHKEEFVVEVICWKLELESRFQSLINKIWVKGSLQERVVLFPITLEVCFGVCSLTFELEVCKSRILFEMSNFMVITSPLFPFLKKTFPILKPFLFKCHNVTIEGFSLRSKCSKGMV